jgi:hypothetical protein
MNNSPKSDKIRFWPLLGLIIGIDIVLTFLYSIIFPGLSTSSWADALCVSAFLLAFGSIIPVFLDAGRGFGLAGKMGEPKSEQRQALTRERALREKGIKMTFVLALATVLIGLLSLLLSLL